MRRLVFTVLFAVLALVMFAFIAPLIAGPHSAKLAQAAFPFLVIIGGGIGFLIGTRSERLHKARVERMKEARQAGDPANDKPGQRDRTYDY